MVDFIVCLMALMFVCSQRHMRAILWQNLESINSCQINKRCKMQRWTVSSDLLWKMSFYAFGRAIYWLITNHLYVLEAKCKTNILFIRHVVPNLYDWLTSVWTQKIFFVHIKLLGPVLFWNKSIEIFFRIIVLCVFDKKVDARFFDLLVFKVEGQVMDI